MIAADTNVWARACLNDDHAQAERARAALAEARSAGGVFVSLVVLVELAWVLRAQWSREEVLVAIEDLLHTNGVIIESPLLVQRAVEASRKGGTGFGDHLIAQIAFESGASEIITFDRAFGRLPRVRRLK
jgi:predicted nucleic-acid-binding protein